MSTTTVKATMEQRVAEVRERLEGVTSGPWFVWDGVQYMGGGRDLCIGAGPTWMANMDHRACERRVVHMEADMRAQDCKAEADTDLLSLASCELADDFTNEQIANARFIARAREDIPFLLAVIDYLDKQTDELSSENWRLRNSDSPELSPADPDGLRAYRDKVIALLHEGTTQSSGRGDGSNG